MSYKFLTHHSSLIIHHCLALFGFSAAVGLVVLLRYPVVYGGDPIVRLTNWERLRLAYQLPMIQVVVHLATRVTPDPVFLRLALVVIAALGACGLARLTSSVFGSESGIYAGLFFASNHFLIFLGNAPYQEVLELTLLLWGLALIFGESNKAAQAAGYLLLAAACLTRYEAWFVALAAALVRLLLLRSERRPGPLEALRRALPFGIGPLAWILLNRGFSPAGTILFDPSLRLARLWRIPYVIGASVNHTTSAIVLLALFGLAAWWRDLERRRNPVVATLLLAVALFLLALPLTATGVLPDYDRYVTNREAHFLLPCFFLLAAAGLSWFRSRVAVGRVAPAVLVFLVVFAYEGYATKKIIDQSVSEGNLQLDGRLARLLSARLGPGQSALIFAQPFPPEETRHFLEMIRRRQGEAGAQAAREMMARINQWPFDYARIWVHAPRLRERLLRAQEAGAMASASAAAVVFDDYTPANPAEQALLDSVRKAAATIQRYAASPSGRTGATVYFLPGLGPRPRQGGVPDASLQPTRLPLPNK